MNYAGGAGDHRNMCPKWPFPHRQLGTPTIGNVASRYADRPGSHQNHARSGLIRDAIPCRIGREIHRRGLGSAMEGAIKRKETNLPSAAHLTTIIPLAASGYTNTAGSESTTHLKRALTARIWMASDTTNQHGGDVTTHFHNVRIVFTLLVDQQKHVSSTDLADAPFSLLWRTLGQRLSLSRRAALSERRPQFLTEVGASATGQRRLRCSLFTCSTCNETSNPHGMASQASSATDRRRYCAVGYMWV